MDVDVNGGILEPKGKAPGILHKQVDVRAGVARDALAVAFQVGDILFHLDPEDADEIATAMIFAAKTVRALRAQRDGRIASPGA